MLGISFTGYLLPWDQKAYFATTVGTNILIIFHLWETHLRVATRRDGDGHIDALPLFVPPGVADSLSSSPLSPSTLCPQSWTAGPVQGEPEALKQSTEPFYPNRLSTIDLCCPHYAGLGLLAHYALWSLAPRQIPLTPQICCAFRSGINIPVFQWLEVLGERLARPGILVIPAFVALLFVALPFLDRRPEAPAVEAPGLSIDLRLRLHGAGRLGAISHRHDLRDPSIAPQLQSSARTSRPS